MAEFGTGKPVVLVILDGWGIGRDEPGNAILRAATPAMDRLWASYPHEALRTSGEDIGLPAGQMGNSEVGHLNLGAGFVVYQWLTRLDRAIADGSFFANPVLLQAMARVRADGGALHLIGLVSEGGVHSHVRHLAALLGMAQREGVPHVAVHAITDGRDTPPTSGAKSIADLDATLRAEGNGRIATVCGRYWAMDRDHRWERTERAYDAIVRGVGARAASAEEAVARSYAAGVTDEFIAPTVIDDGRGPVIMRPGDAVICFNFRADRMRQLVEALTLPDFHGFDRGPAVPDLFVATMARYEADLPVAIAFEPHDVVHPLAGVIAEAGLAQFHAAETEKYAHVTFFLNGGREAPFPGEERALVPSPQVATYDLLPEMSAPAVTDAVVAAIRSGKYAFVIVNFANGDMVGHTGSLPAAIRAVETVDRCLGEVVAATLAADGVALVTADHGNAEAMIDPQSGLPLTAHTTNPVPFILVAPDDSPLRHARLRPGGRLAAVAPTVLALLGVSLPPEMTEPGLAAAAVPSSA